MKRSPPDGLVFKYFTNVTNYSFSIGSAGDREFDEADEEEEGETGVNGHASAATNGGGGGGGGGFTAIDMFLAGLGLSQYSKIFRKHQVCTTRTTEWASNIRIVNFPIL